MSRQKGKGGGFASSASRSKRSRNPVLVTEGHRVFPATSHSAGTQPHMISSSGNLPPVWYMHRSKLRTTMKPITVASRDFHDHPAATEPLPRYR
jgi:hypothetical protein